MDKYLGALLLLLISSALCSADTVSPTGGTLKQSILRNLQENGSEIVYVVADINDPEVLNAIRLRSNRGKATRILLAEYPSSIEKWVRIANDRTRVFVLTDSAKKAVWTTPMMVIDSLVAWTPSDSSIEIFTKRECSGGFYTTTGFSNGIRELLMDLRKEQGACFEIKNQ